MRRYYQANVRSRESRKGRAPARVRGSVPGLPGPTALRNRGLRSVKENNSREANRPLRQFVRVSSPLRAATVALPKGGSGQTRNKRVRDFVGARHVCSSLFGQINNVQY